MGKYAAGELGAYAAPKAEEAAGFYDLFDAINGAHVGCIMASRTL